jgi:hypothetical protein
VDCPLHPPSGSGRSLPEGATGSAGIRWRVEGLETRCFHGVHDGCRSVVRRRLRIALDGHSRSQREVEATTSGVTVRPIGVKGPKSPRVPNVRQGDRLWWIEISGEVGAVGEPTTLGSFPRARRGGRLIAGRAVQGGGAPGASSIASQSFS